MKLIIAGTRTIELPESFIETSLLHFGLKPTIVLSGACGLGDDQLNKEQLKAKGVDGAGERWAYASQIPVIRFYAKWKLHGKPAGPNRNATMAGEADAAMVLWDGISSGSNNLIHCMAKLKKPVYQVIFRGQHG